MFDYISAGQYDLNKIPIDEFITYDIDRELQTCDIFPSKTNDIKKQIRKYNPGVAVIKNTMNADLRLIMIFDGAPCYSQSYVSFALKPISINKLYNEYGRNRDAFMRALNRKKPSDNYTNYLLEKYAHTFYALYKDKDLAYEKLMEFIKL